MLNEHTALPVTKDRSNCMVERQADVPEGVYLVQIPLESTDFLLTLAHEEKFYDQLR